jgi:hypothetical protein
MATETKPCGCEIATVDEREEYFHVAHCAMHAAAPEMVAMLEELTQEYDEGEWGPACPYCKKLRAGRDTPVEHEDGCKLAELLRRVRGGPSDG